jgi:hypothetical protein
MINAPFASRLEYEAALVEIEPHFAKRAGARYPEADRFDLLTL